MKSAIKPIRGLPVRFGQLIQLGTAERTYNNANNKQRTKEALQKWKDWIEKESKKTQQPEGLIRLKRWRNLLNILAKIGERQPTIYEVAAILARNSGLKKEKLIIPLRMLSAIENRRPQFKTWEGSVRSLYIAVRQNLPYEINKVLEQNKKILNSREIAEKLAISWDTKNQTNINTALQLLNQMGWAEKGLMQPSFSAAGGGAMSTWSYKKHGPLTIRHPNSALYLLESIYKNKDKRTTTNSILKPWFNFRGNPKAMLSYRRGLQLIKKLEEKGLIKTERKTKPSHGTLGKVEYIEISFTKEGLRIMEKFYRLDRKSFHDLRAYLLGIK
ncbi:MAG: hypothetical protein J4415_03205 [Candidatus Diapherotrites archaeon]|uniref:Uncharacterized protein n=1 Tax=Candidatus Iainarchaeum sp. TaxID=3101447 RepID=A0A8T4KRG5_9ARCH|nr:hypothetical protein [Candidatus Diapherotrites archaeon]